MARHKKHHVASGEYYVAATTPLHLQAFLGTCVGVTVVDRRAGVGGLLHILLPEPTSRRGAATPGRYATTGIPSFVEALRALGAKNERMEAVVAGGALVGPVSEMDLSLDIGGRTAEVVTRLLAKEGIDIARTETGGFFTCSLALDLQTLETRIEPAGIRAPETETRQPGTGKSDIAKSIDTLQPIPQVALKILRLIDDEAADIAAIAAEVRKDQVISAQVLRLCNSSLFARRVRIDSLDDALVLLGQRMFVQMVVSAALRDFFNRSTSGYSICKGGIFHHSVGTAIFSERLARFIGKVPAGLAYTAGLLHDIGKVALDQHVTEMYPLFYREFQEDQADITRIEQKVFGTDHVEIGTELARRWAFPESLTHVVAFHHDPHRAQADVELVHTVYLADLLMTRFFTGFELERINAEGLKKCMAFFGIGSGRFPDLVDLMPVGSLTCAPELAMEED